MNKKNKYVLYFDKVSKDYGEGRGNFNISLGLYEGETLGLVGENGAGKTTLLRQAMGFVKPDKGQIHIYDLDAYKQADLTKNYIGYIPGEINFPDVKSGSEFIHQYAKQINLGEESFKKADEVIKRMQLDISAYPRRMSKGMKQKTSIVVALMKQAPILLLDEPTTGLDPLMRDEFLTLIQEEKAQGTSIIMSSNTIEELEKVADRVAFISKGKIIDIADMEAIRNRKLREYKIEFDSPTDYKLTKKEYRSRIIRDQPQYNQVSLRIKQEDTKSLLTFLSGKKVKFISQIPYTLQTYFDQSRSNKELN